MRIKKSEPNVAEIDMTPMIDIVFQLIAFFMVITNFENTRADERVTLPEDQLARPLDIPRDSELVLNVGLTRDRDGNVVDPQPMLFYGDGTDYTLDEANRVLGRERSYFEDIGTDIGEVTVVIRSDGDVPAGRIQKLIQTGQEAGFTLFSVKAQQPE